MTKREFAEALAREALRGYFESNGGFNNMDTHQSVRATDRVSKFLDQALSPPPPPQKTVVVQNVKKYGALVSCMVGSEVRKFPIQDKTKQQKERLLFDTKAEAEKYVKERNDYRQNVVFSRQINFEIEEVNVEVEL